MLGPDSSSDGSASSLKRTPCLQHGRALTNLDRYSNAGAPSLYVHLFHGEQKAGSRPVLPPCATAQRPARLRATEGAGVVSAPEKTPIPQRIQTACFQRSPHAGPLPVDQGLTGWQVRLPTQARPKKRVRGRTRERGAGRGAGKDLTLSRPDIWTHAESSSSPEAVRSILTTRLPFKPRTFNSEEILNDKIRLPGFRWLEISSVT